MSRNHHNRIFTGYINRVVVPGAAAGGTFNIMNPNRTSKLISVSFDIRIRTGTVELPLEQNTTQFFFLNLFAFPGSAAFAQSFEPVAPFPIVGNGVNFAMFRPGQIKFDSFYVRNQLMFVLNYTNNDLVNNFEYHAMVTAELQDVDET